MKNVLLFFAFALILQSSTGQSRIDYSNYQQSIHENFYYQNMDQLAKSWALQDQQATYNLGSALYSPAQISLLPQGGIRLTATPLANSLAAREPQGHHYFYKSGMISRDLDSDYGIFEIIAKIPNGQPDVNDAWPIFKLVGDKTELTIFDGHNDINEDLRQNISTTINKETKYQCGNSWNLEAFHDGWENDFHVFQAAWTPDAITFFIHGREVATIKTNQLDAPITNLKLVVALQTDEVSSQPIHFDIKEINVYKHIEGRPYDYMAKNSWEFHQVTSDLFDTKVLAQNSAIVPNPNNTNEVFYIGQDHLLYVAQMAQNNWKVTTVSNQPISGSLTYVKNNNTLLFRATDGSLSGFSRKGNQFLPFTKSNIKLANGLNVLATTAQGNIIAILANGKIAYLDNHSNALTLMAMGNIEYHGDLTVTNDETIFFKGKNNQLKAVQRRDLSFQDVALPTIQVASTPGSILFTTYTDGLGIAFHGADDKLHLLKKINDVQYRHSIPTFDYHQDAAHSSYIASNLAGGQDVFYVAEGGRLHVDGWNNQHTERKHFWVDDNFFTENYLADAQATSLAVGATGQVFYRTKAGNLGYFNWESSQKGCDCQTLHADQSQNFNIGSLVSVDAFPNPTMGHLTISIHKTCANCTYQYELVAASGQRITKGTFEGQEKVIDFEDQPAGVYQLNIVSENERFSKRIVKMK